MNMDKPKFEPPSIIAENVAKIAELFPGAVTEEKVNFDLLRSLLGDEVYGDEAYEFTWVGKKSAIAEAGRPIRKTLRPCVEESKHWDATENLYIEGDNLDVLKLLQESYLGKIKMMYIDPPYNTGSDFIYRDDFAQSREEYDKEAGVFDEDGDRLFKNTETNGRFHSDWCSMIYPRLVLARNLLRDDGVIFISIDDNEIAQLRKVCDEVFGVGNFQGCILWKKKTNGNNMGVIPPVHDYIVVYSKNSSRVVDIGFEVSSDEQASGYSNPDNDHRGLWDTMDLSANHKGPYFAITNPLNGQVHYPPQGRYWVFNEQEVLRRIADGRIIFGKSGTARPVQKVFLKERGTAKRKAESWWDSHGMNEDATEELTALFGVAKIFSHPKPTKLLKNIISIVVQNGDIVLDFFSGSGTTADAVMQIAAEKSLALKYIMVQLPEDLEESMKKADNNAKAALEVAIDFLKSQEMPLLLSELGKERIRRAGEKIKVEARLTAQNLDIGFRVLKLDSTNMRDVYYAAGEYTQDLLAGMEDNIKDDRTDMDLLYACLLDWGLPLSMPHAHEKIDGFTVHTYNDGDLIACFDKHISDAVVKEIAKRQPLRAVFRDSSFTNSPEKINVEEIFKLLAPNTSVKVI
jgi:adenine-specific DNA-methyltransferase